MDFLDLESIETALTAPDLEQRQLWAAKHRALLGRTLDAPNVNQVPQRLFRTRCWQDGQMVVLHLLQRFNVAEGAVRVSAFVTRSYQHFPTHYPKYDLSGRYSLDELVAFLRLDIVDPDDIHWADETGYVLVPEGPGIVNALMRKVSD